MRRTRGAIAAVVMLVVAVVTASGLTGCSFLDPMSGEQIAALEARVGEIRQVVDDTTAQIEGLRAIVGTLSPEHAAPANEAIAELELRLGQARQVLAGAEQQLAEASKTGGVSGADVTVSTISGVAAFLPPPWNGVVAGAAGLAAAGLAAYSRQRNRTALVTVVRAIESSKDGVGDVRLGDPIVKRQVAAAMDPRTRAMVEAIREQAQS